jgi:hypothetical protein
MIVLAAAESELQLAVYGARNELDRQSQRQIVEIGSDLHVAQVDRQFALLRRREGLAPALNHQRGAVQ